MDRSLAEIIKELRAHEKIFILTHQSPDGDTLGSAFSLCYALKQEKKQVKVLCSDPFPNKFGYLLAEYEDEDFIPDLIVSVDVADVKLLGDKTGIYADQIQICMDHHCSNRLDTVPMRYVDGKAAAACEVIYQLLCEMGSTITPLIADCLYTGIATDTGCFKFSNTTGRTHRIAAELMELGCHFETINRELFDTKSKARIEVERAVLSSMEFYFDNQVSMVAVPQKLLQESHMDPSDLDGIASLPRQIEGVEVGVTIKERPEGGYKVSVRTGKFADASEICGRLGGGGHMRAAGCFIQEDLETAKKLLVEAIRPVFTASKTGKVTTE